MNKYNLIFKNWLRSLWKIKIIFLLFLFFNIILGAILSALLETNFQVQKQANLFNVNDPEYGNTEIYNGITEKFNKETAFHFFCTDYFEIKKLNPETGKNEVKRIPYLSFGGYDKEACFKELEFKNKFNDSDSQNKINFNIKNSETGSEFGVFDNIEVSEFELNENSQYYQNSMHYRLIDLYRRTNDKKFLEMSENLLDQTNLSISLHLTEKYTKEYIDENFINKNHNLYLSHRLKETSLFTDFNFLKDEVWNNYSLLNENDNFVQRISDYKNNIVESENNWIIKNQRKTFEIWKNWTENIVDKLLQINLEKDENIDEEIFENNIKNWIENWKNNENQNNETESIYNFALEYPIYWINWIKNKFELLKNNDIQNDGQGLNLNQIIKEERNSILWILFNINDIIKLQKRKSKNVLINLFNKTQKLIDLNNSRSWENNIDLNFLKMIDDDNDSTNPKITIEQFQEKLIRNQISSNLYFWNEKILNQKIETFENFGKIAFYFQKKEFIQGIIEEIKIIIPKIIENSEAEINNIDYYYSDYEELKKEEKFLTINQIEDLWNDEFTKIRKMNFYEIRNISTIIKYKINKIVNWVAELEQIIIDYKVFVNQVNKDFEPAFKISDNFDLEMIDEESDLSDLNAANNETLLNEKNLNWNTENLISGFILPQFEEDKKEIIVSLDNFLNIWETNMIDFENQSSEQLLSWKKMIEIGHDYIEGESDYLFSDVPIGGDNLSFKPWAKTNKWNQLNELHWKSFEKDNIYRVQLEEFLNAVKIVENEKIYAGLNIEEKWFDYLTPGSDYLYILDFIFKIKNNIDVKVLFDEIQAETKKYQKDIILKILNEEFYQNRLNNLFIDHDFISKTKMINLTEIKDGIENDEVYISDYYRNIINELHLAYIKEMTSDGNGDSEFLNRFINSKNNSQNSPDYLIYELKKWIVGWNAQDNQTLIETAKNDLEIIQSKTFSNGIDLKNVIDYITNLTPNQLWFNKIKQISNNHIKTQKTWNLNDSDIEELYNYVKTNEISKDSEVPWSWFGIKNNTDNPLATNKNWFNYLDFNSDFFINNLSFNLQDEINQWKPETNEIVGFEKKFLSRNYQKEIVTNDYYLDFNFNIPGQIKSEIINNVNDVDYKSLIENEIKINDDFSTYQIENIIEKDTEPFVSVDEEKEIETEKYWLVFQNNVPEATKLEIANTINSLNIQKLIDFVTFTVNKNNNWWKYILKKVYLKKYSHLDSDKTIDNKFYKIIFKNNLTDEQKIEFESKINDFEKKYFNTIVGKIKNWKNQTFKYFDLTNNKNTPYDFGVPGHLKDLSLNNYIGEFKLNIQKFAGILSGLELEPLINIYLKERKTDDEVKKYLFIRTNEEKQYKLIEGLPEYTNNEIVVSPFTRRNNPEFQINNQVDILELKNLKITGIGIQKEFLHPFLSKFQTEMPNKSQHIIYLNSETYNLLKGSYLRHLQKPIFFDETQEMFIKSDPKDTEETRTEKFKTFSNWIGYGDGSFTDASLKINNQTLSADEIVNDEKFTVLIKHNIKKDIGLKYYNFMLGFVKLNVWWILWSLIFALFFFIFLIGFSTIYIVEKKINMNKEALGVIKSLGIKNKEIWLGLIPIALFIFIAVSIGWVFGLFLQNILFDALEKWTNFEFNRFVLNYQSLSLAFLFIFFSIFITIFLFEKIKFSKWSILYLINNAEKNSNKFLTNIQNNILKRIPKGKNIYLKLNYIFISILWKKILFLSIIFIITAFSIMSGILFFTIKGETIKKTYENVNFDWKFNYLPVNSGNPFTRKSYWENPSFEEVLNPSPEYNGRILKYSNFDLYKTSYDDKDAVPEKFYPVINNGLGFIQPLYGKLINYNFISGYLNEVALGNEQTRKEVETFICNTALNIGSTPKAFAEGTNCLKEILTNNIPVEYNDERIKEKYIENFPISIGKVQYQKKYDSFFTQVKGKLKNKKDGSFLILGLNNNKDVFDIDSKIKEEILVKQDQDPLTDEIKIIANTNFLQKYKYKVGDTIDVSVEKFKLFYKNHPEEIKLKDWEYTNYENEIKTFDDFPQDAQFFNSEKFDNELKSKIENKEIKLFYLGAEGENGNHFHEMIDLNRVTLTLPNGEKIRPFNPSKDTLRHWNFSNISKMSELIESEDLRNDYIWEDGKIAMDSENPEQKSTLKMKIVSELKEYRQPKLIIPQKYANLLLDYPISKDFNGKYRWFNGKYSFSKDIWNTMYNHGISNNYGYINFDLIHIYGIKSRKSIIQGRYPITIEKELATQVANYFIELNLVLIIFMFVLIIFMFVWLTKSSLFSIADLTFKLKFLGYSNKKILFQSLQHILIPFIICFCLGTFLAILALNQLSYFAINNYDKYLFFSNNYIYLLIGFLPMFLILIYIIIKNNKANEKADLAQKINS